MRYIFVLIISLLVQFLFAHSGRTDDSGGHNDYIDGGYHYHHGEPAHEYCGEDCPYGGNDYYYDEYQDEDDEEKSYFWLYVIGGGGVWLLWHQYKEEQERKRRVEEELRNRNR